MQYSDTFIPDSQLPTDYTLSQLLNNSEQNTKTDSLSQIYNSTPKNVILESKKDVVSESKNIVSDKQYSPLINLSSIFQPFTPQYINKHHDDVTLSHYSDLIDIKHDIKSILQILTIQNNKINQFEQDINLLHAKISEIKQQIDLNLTKKNNNNVAYKKMFNYHIKN